MEKKICIYNYQQKQNENMEIFIEKIHFKEYLEINYNADFIDEEYLNKNSKNLTLILLLIEVDERRQIKFLDKLFKFIQEYNVIYLIRFYNILHPILSKSFQLKDVNEYIIPYFNTNSVDKYRIDKKEFEKIIVLKLLKENYYYETIRDDYIIIERYCTSNKKEYKKEILNEKNDNYLKIDNKKIEYQENENLLINYAKKDNDLYEKNIYVIIKKIVNHKIENLLEELFNENENLSNVRQEILKNHDISNFSFVNFIIKKN